nr:InlB B-repeat-containing protein [Clostridia bacterium]
MKIATKRIILYALSALFALCVGFAVAFSVQNAAYADEPTVVNLKIHTANPTQYQNNALNNTTYWTSLCFLNADDANNQGVSTGETSGYNFSDLLSKTTYTGAANTINYYPASIWGWATNTKSATFRFIYLRTANSPTEGDTVAISAGAWFTTGGTINEKYVLAEDINLRFNGTGWEIYVPYVEPTVKNVSFLKIDDTWNNYAYSQGGYTRYSLVKFTGGISTGSHVAGNMDMSNLKANTTYTGSDLSWDFISSSLIYGENSANNNLIIFRTSANPAEGDTLEIKAGAWFITGGTINEKYVLTSDINLEFNGTTWEVRVLEPTTVEITYDKIADQNSAPIGNPVSFYLTRLYFDKKISAGVKAEKDFSNLNANTTYTGSDTEYFWQSGNDVGFPENTTDYKFIYLKTTTLPNTGDEISVKAGAWFITGGTVNEKYVLAEDMNLRFDGTAWGTVGQFAIERVLWNGSDQSGKNGAQLTAWGIENDGAAAAKPLVGTCALLSVGTLSVAATANLASSITGIKYNGTPISEVDGALVAEWLTHLFIYVPYRTGLITIEEGAFVGNKYADKEYHYILNEHSSSVVWVQAVNPQLIDGEWVDLYGKQEVKFSCVNVSWNNVRNYASGDKRLVQTILDFDYTDKNRPEVQEGETAPILWLGKASSSVPSAVAKRITVNGVKLSEIAGAYVDYSQGYNHMFVVIPESALIPTAEYPATKLEILENAVFEDSVLPQLTLTLIGGAWVVGEFEQYDLPADGYKTVADVSGSDTIKIYANTQAASVIDGENVDFRFLLSADSIMKNGAPAGYMTLYLKATQDRNWDGFRFDFRFDWTTLRYVVNVYDASTVNQEEVDEGGSGHKLLGTFPVGFAAKDCASFAFIITEENGLYNIVIVEDGLKLGEITGVNLRGDRIGNAMLVYSPLVEWTLRNYKAGDVSAPVVYVNTREEYFLEEGDVVPEFEYRIYDRTDATEDVATEVRYDESALDNEEKLIAGEYEFEIIATDQNGNIAVKKIILHVAGEQRFTITFDGKNGVEYVFGSLIEEPETPAKAATTRVYYVFDGWYNGEVKWDFANDTVSSDLNLVSRFTEKDVLYKITFTGLGDEDVEVYAKYGAQPDLSFLEKSGYNVVLKVDGESVDRIIVMGDTTVAVSYAKNGGGDSGKKGGCGSEINSGYIIIPVLLTLAGVMILRKKEN